MIRSVYKTAMSMLVQQKKQENNANNMANISTVGFKSKEILTEASFSEVLANHASGNGKSAFELGSLPLGTSISGYDTDWEQGVILQTGNAMDFALEGEGFFKFESPLGVLLSRDGELQQNSDGIWTNKSGLKLLKNGDSGNLEYVQTEPGQSIVVTANGSIFADQQRIGRLIVVRPIQNERVETMDSGYYRTGIDNLEDSDQTTIYQGALETSNVEAAEALIDMMSTGRLLQTQQRILNTLDETMNRAANEIGKL